VIFLPEERERKEGNQEYFPFFLSSGIPEEKGGGILSLFPPFPLFLLTLLPEELKMKPKIKSGIESSLDNPIRPLVDVLIRACSSR